MHKLIKPLLGMLLLLFTGYYTFGQVRVPALARSFSPIEATRQAPAKRIELLKENFISKRLNLSLKDARVFWPVYRQYVQEQTAVRILKRMNNSDASANGTEQIDKELSYEAQLVEIRKHYRDEFLKILPPEKVSELYKSEREFTDEMVKQLSERSIKAGD
jgi:hypothetical protein